MTAVASLVGAIATIPATSPPTPPGRVAEAYTRPFVPPTIDGRLDEPLWLQARPIADFVQDEPVEGAAATERTEVLIAVDDSALYVGARLFDETPHAIRAGLARRDQEVSTDGFILYLSPHHDRRSGFYFGVSAGGTQYDGTLSNDDWRDDSWDGVWASGVALTERGWTVEMRIPLSQLRFDGGVRRCWGINLERIIERKKEHDLLAYTPRTESGFVSRFLDLTGVEAIVPPARIELVPYFSAGARYVAHDLGDPFGGRVVPPRAGLDLKLGLGGHLTLSGTVFPDFGQVEVDPAVINLSDIETFYPEKRPFFVEGASILGDFGRGGANGSWNFDWPNPLVFYSRRIGRAPQGELPDEADFHDEPSAVDILGATKLTGQIGATSVGSLLAVAAPARARVSTAGVVSELPVEPLTGYGMARVLRSVAGGRHGLGAIATVVGRDLSEPGLAAQLSKTAAVAGADGWLSLDPQREWVLTGWSAVSQITGTAERITAAQKSSVRYYQRPLASHLHLDETRTSLSGYAGRVVVNRQLGNVVFNAAAGAMSPGFELNDLGFISNTDRINGHVLTGYRWTTPGRYVKGAGLRAAYLRSWDFGWTRTTDGLWVNHNLQLTNYWSWWVEGTAFRETTSTRRTRGGPPMLSPAGRSLSGGFGSDEARAVSGGAWLSGDVTDKGAGAGHGTGGFIALRLADRFAFRVDPEYRVAHNAAQYLDTVEDPTATATFGQRYLFGDLWQRTFSATVRTGFVFTPRLSFELFLQPLVSSLHYRSVRALAAPYSFDFEPSPRDPAEFSETIVSLRGSAVLRWEYLPGSTLFVVWNGNQSDDDPDSRFGLGRRLGAIRRLAPNHVFMVKLTYWWGL